MKKILLTLPVMIAGILVSVLTFAQAGLAPDQNPAYAVSRAKYMKVADSTTRWQSTTQHEIYKAVDWLADRAEARADRREFRRQVRMERARWIDYNGSYYQPNNYYYRNHHSFNRYNNWRRNRPLGLFPSAGLNFWWR